MILSGAARFNVRKRARATVFLEMQGTPQNVDDVGVSMTCEPHTTQQNAGAPQCSAYYRASISRAGMQLPNAGLVCEMTQSQENLGGLEVGRPALWL